MQFYGRNHSIGEKGQSVAETLVRTEFDWIYRQQPTSDIGIDGEIELIGADRRSTALLIKTQVKTTETFGNGNRIKVQLEKNHIR
jgi:hypothetical protein